jgi:hypothetical protein
MRKKESRIFGMTIRPSAKLSPQVDFSVAIFLRGLSLRGQDLCHKKIGPNQNLARPDCMDKVFASTGRGREIGKLA